jgi:hypothetical protein
MAGARKFSVPAFIAPVVADLEDADAGKLFKAILAYDGNGKGEDLPQTMRLIFLQVKVFLDNDMRRRENGTHGGRKPGLTEINRKKPEITGINREKPGFSSCSDTAEASDESIAELLEGLKSFE